MKKLLFLFFAAFLCIGVYAQAFIDPLLMEEMDRRGDEGKTKVIVIMNARYDRNQLNRRASYFVTRAERREFVVNELKEFSNASQYDLRRSLAEMQRNGLTTEPTILWMANALSFEATNTAIENLAQRNDIEMIGYAIERNWIPDGEVAKSASASREITPNVIKVNADQVWELGYTGEGVLVAVIDTGVNYNHYDLADHLWDGGVEFPNHGYDVYNNDNDPMDDQGHGSHCAGTVCGDGTSGSHTGVAPDATLMCVKCLSSSGNGGAENISAGIQWAVEHGCDMFSMSLGIPLSSIPERTLLRQTCEAALDAGIVAAIAAGNEGDKQYQYPIPNNVRVPGSCPPPYMDDVQGQNPGAKTCSVCVGAVDYNDNAANFTSHGPVTWTNTEFGDYPYQPEIGLIRPDVCAPGVDIKSLNFATNSGYTTMSGTSMATPCVAGCMALMLSKDNRLTPAEVCRILEETAVPLTESKSNIYGFGRVNVLEAIEAIQLGAIKYVDFQINDPLGNNDHKLNPGEAVSMAMTLNNITDEAVNNVSVVLSSADEHVTITGSTAQFPDFAANQTYTLDDAFAFSINDEVEANHKVRFEIAVYVNGEEIGHFAFNVFVYDYLLKYDATAVMNDNSGEGMLNPGETADLRIMVENIGNELAQAIVGTLSSDYQFVTINEVEKDFSTIGAGLLAFADFNVTLDAAAPEDFVIPFTLDLVDAFGRHTMLDFSFKNICNVVFSLHDSYGDGWQGNYLTVAYSDGTPTEQMTLESGSSATYVRQVATGSTISLTWHNGQWTQECSFEITYEDGESIFESIGGFSGTKTFTIDCTNGISLPEFCNPVQNLAYEIDDHDVILTWEAPRGITPMSYEVYRETQLLATLYDLTFTDPDMEDGVYNYCVYAIYTDCQSEFVCETVEVSSCGSVQNLAYTLNDDLLLSLTWDAPEDQTGWIGYQVYMDEELVGSTNEQAYAFTITEGQHNVVVRALFEECEKDARVQVCVVGAVEDLGYIEMENHNVQVIWLPIEGISEYDVYVNGEWTKTVDGTVYVAEFEPGSTAVTVKAVAEGCYVLSSSIDVCIIDPIENMVFGGFDEENRITCSWSPVAYAEYYSLIVNGDAIVEQLTEPYYTFTPQVGSNEVCVIATSVYGCFTWPYECATQMVCPAVEGFDYAFNGNEVEVTWSGDADFYEIVLDGSPIEMVDTPMFTATLEGEHVLQVTPVVDEDCIVAPALFNFNVSNIVPEIQVTNVRQGLIATAWTAVEGAIGYKLFRDGQPIAEGLTEAAYNDTEMPIDAVHCYAVQSVFEKGVSDLSETACANYFTGLVENDGEVSIFPNPTSDKVTIRCAGMTRIDVYTMEGKLVRSIMVENDEYQLDGLQNGIYSLRIMKGEETVIGRLIKM